MDRPRRPLSQRDAWERTLWLWEVYFAVVCASVVVSVAVGAGTAAGRRLAAIVAVIVMAVLYRVAGRGLVQARDPLRAVAFMAAVAGIFLGALLCSPAVAFLLFAICPLAFMTMPLGPAIGFVAVANLLSPAVSLVRDGVTDRLVTHLAPISAASIAFSIWMGVWIGQVVRQSEERADLIAQLEETRAEAARLSREAGIAAERARLAGEIHDTLAQGFTSIITLLQAADAELDRDPDQARGRLGLAVRTARENLAESRTLVQALAPSELDAGSLEKSVGRQVRRLAEETSIAASYRTVGDVRSLPMRVEVVLLRAAQEALANVRKHARAAEVQVCLAYADDSIRLTVRDDGRGFDTADTADTADTSGGYGLRGMRARAEQVSGSLRVHSGPSIGTTVELEVPR